MEHALVVIDPSEGSKALVEEAGKLAAGVAAKITLLHVTTEETYADRRVEMESISDSAETYSLTQAKAGAENFAEDVGREVLADIDVEWTARGAIGEYDVRTIEEAKSLGCDHVFISGVKRSPTGKALFGDHTQQVILNFNGPVTVLTT